MDRLVLYQGVFGCWGWEVVDEDSRQVVAESLNVFGNQDECLQDARLRGYCGDARIAEPDRVSL